MQFANIGKAVLIQMLGLQKNYSETVVGTKQILNEKQSGCNECKIFKYQTFKSGTCDHNCTECRNCPSKKYTEIDVINKTYFNELNRFGYKPMLKPIAIKLMLLLHFYSPDADGYCFGIDPFACADYLNCNIRSIKNNLSLLSEYGYIEWVKISPHCYNILLTDYSNYYSPASQGGRGYFVLSMELLDSINKTTKVNELRVLLRELLDFDNLLGKGNYTINNKTIKQIKNYLPNYCKDWIIKDIMDSLASYNNIFSISPTNTGYAFKLNQEFNTKDYKETAICIKEHEIEQFINGFNYDIARCNKPGIVLSDYYKKFFDDYTLGWNAPIIDWEDIYSDNGFGKLAIQYTVEHVKIAVMQIYKDYVMNYIPIQNVYGLLHTVIEEGLELSH